MEHFLGELIVRFGYIGLFAALALGIIGLPVPDETLLTFAGYNAFLGKLHFSITLLIAFIGAASGISISYLIGYKLGLPFLKKYGPKLHITEKRIARTRRLFKKYGNFLLILGFFIPGVRHLTAYITGIANIGWRRFMLYAYSGALIWSITFISLGYKLGEKWYIVGKYVHKYGFFVLLICLIAAFFVFAYLYLRKAKVTGEPG
ncbi:DedA family protein [Fictibacillus sp. Mic-4]|uniref:DedA family protein n=1 Tax=Fictibacillus sp. Mic-4 TaxID=3132826 RepID=UPI003CF3AA36